MKKFAYIAFAAVFLIVVVLLWQHFSRSKLTGTWIVDLGNNLSSKTVVKPDGSYVCQITGYTNGKVETIAGFFEVVKTNGYLIDTMTQNSNTNAVVPHVSHAQIVQFDASELVLLWEGTTNEVVLRMRNK
jgi:hypothetical protein